MYDYFASEGARCPKNVNPAEFMIDVVSGDLSKGRDWADVWLNSDNNRRVTEELDRLKQDNLNKSAEVSEEDNHEFASSFPTQARLVLKRASIQVSAPRINFAVFCLTGPASQLWRDTEYVKGKLLLHIFSALFNGFVSFASSSHTVLPSRSSRILLPIEFLEDRTLLRGSAESPVHHLRLHLR